MSDLEDRLALLNERLSTIEAARLRDEVARLERRLAALEGERAKGEKRPNEGLLSPTIKALLVAATAAVVPFSTAIHGCMSHRREQLETEHEIVKGHLENALETDATDVYDLGRLRHLRFLKKFTPRSRSSPDDLKGILGEWAEAEYTQQFARLVVEADTVANKLNECEGTIRQKKANLGVDSGWYAAEAQHWDTESNPTCPREASKIGAVRDQIETILEGRRDEIATLTTDAEHHRSNWDSIKVAFALEGRAAELEGRVYDDALEYYRDRCWGAVTDPDACFAFAEVAYADWLESKHAPTLHAANGAYAVACSEGLGLACVRLARSHRRGEIWQIEEPIDPEDARYRESFDLLERAQLLGEPEAYNGLGWHFHEGKYVERDPDQAYRYFDISCRLASNNGCVSLGTWHLEQSKRPELRGTDEQTEHVDAAKHLYESACNEFEIRACVNLINLLRCTEPSQFDKPTWVEPDLEAAQSNESTSSEGIETK